MEYSTKCSLRFLESHILLICKINCYNGFLVLVASILELQRASNHHSCSSITDFQNPSQFDDYHSN